MHVHVHDIDTVTSDINTLCKHKMNIVDIP